MFQLSLTDPAQYCYGTINSERDKTMDSKLINTLMYMQQRGSLVAGDERTEEKVTKPKNRAGRHLFVRFHHLPDH